MGLTHDKLLTLGLFVFGMDTMAYDELTRRRAWRHAETERMGARAAAQYVGPGEDVVTIAGTLVPEIAGKFSAIDRIVEMADTGDSWPLMDGTGAILGTYRIETMEVQHIVIMAGGIPRIVDFSIDLKRMDG